MKSFMDYLCLTIDQMIFQSLCCLEPMEIHNPVASSYYYTVVSVFFPSSSSSLFNYLFLIITYFLRTSREVSFPFSFCLTVEPESRSRPLLSCNVCSHQRTSFLLSSFPLFRYFSVSHSFYLFPLLIIIIIIIRLTIVSFYISRCAMRFSRIFSRIVTIHGRVSRQIQMCGDKDS